MTIRKLGGKKPKILLIQGSPRKEKSCSNQTSKSEKVCEYLLDKWSPFVDFEYVNLSIVCTVIGNVHVTKKVRDKLPI
jgi:hypothetical protein